MQKSEPIEEESK